MTKRSYSGTEIDKLERFFQECFDEIERFIRRVDDGTNKCSSENSLPSKKKKTVHCIYDQAQEKNDDSYTQSIDSDSNGNSSDDEDEDDDDANHQYTLERANELEAFVHPHNRSDDSKSDYKISFKGLTIHDQENHNSAKAALFLYWPRGIFHLFLYKLLFKHLIISNVFSFFCICR